MWLAAFAAIIVIITLWYSGSLVKDISKDERAKATLWAETIKRRAKLVQETAKLFYMIEEDERKNANIWAQAMLNIVESESEDLTFYAFVLESNSTIPVIVTYESGEIWTYRNLDKEQPDSSELRQALHKMKEVREPIKLVNNQFGESITYYLHYDDSKIYQKIQDIMKDLIDSFISETVLNSASVPVIYTDSSKKEILAMGNIDSTHIQNMSDSAIIAEFSTENEPIEIEIAQGVKNYIFYKNSNLVNQLRYFPIVQLTLFGLFLIVSYLLFSTARRSEQNMVWAGMSKETAHQLGTPLSSLSGWVEILKSKGIEKEITDEIEHDLQRLDTIADRFSKVGSVPEVRKVNFQEVLMSGLEYMQHRTGKGIVYEIRYLADKDTELTLNSSLFHWVIENLIRNAADAMEGRGKIEIECGDLGKYIYVDIKDNGKGISKSKRRQIFEPGYTTKKRGWGLGLSLAKRIIENYHKGKIFVNWSEPGMGTIFRIQLRKK